MKEIERARERERENCVCVLELNRRPLRECLNGQRRDIILVFIN